MRLLFAGTPHAAVPSLDALLASEHEVIAVLTRPDAGRGRGRAAAASPVRVHAEAHGIEVLTPPGPSDPQLLTRLGELAPDACPVVAYGGLVPASALDVPRHGWVNLHFSLLPAWRGAAPVQHAIMAGDEVTGATTFRLEAGLDTGPVYGVLTEPISATDTAADLLGRLSHAGAGLLVATLDGIADGSLQPVPQPADGVSHAPRLSVEDARIRWSAPAVAIERQVRGCTPAPGAWTGFRGERVKLAPLGMPGEPGPGLAPGELSVTKRKVLVGTGSGALLLGELQPHGRQLMPAADWARGARVRPGEAFHDD